MEARTSRQQASIAATAGQASGSVCAPMAVPLFDTATPLEPLRARARERAARACSTPARYILGPEVEAFEREFAAYLGVRPRRRRRQRHRRADDRAARARRRPGRRGRRARRSPSTPRAEAIPPTGARPVFCDVDPDTFCVTRRDGARRADAAHEGGHRRRTCSATSRRSPRSRRSACRCSRTRRRPRARAPTAGRAGSLGTRRDVLASSRPRTSARFGDGGAIATDDDAVAERVRDAALPRLARQGQPTSEVGYNSRLDELQAAILRVLLPHLDAWADGRRAAGARTTRRPGSASCVALPVPIAGRRARVAPVRRAPRARRRARRGAARPPASARAAYYRVPVHRQPAMARVGARRPRCRAPRRRRARTSRMPDEPARIAARAGAPRSSPRSTSPRCASGST